MRIAASQEQFVLPILFEGGHGGTSNTSYIQDLHIPFNRRDPTEVNSASWIQLVAPIQVHRNGCFGHFRLFFESAGRSPEFTVVDNRMCILLGFTLDALGLVRVDWYAERVAMASLDHNEALDVAKNFLPFKTFYHVRIGGLLLLGFFWIDPHRFRKHNGEYSAPFEEAVSILQIIPWFQLRSVYRLT